MSKTRSKVFCNFKTYLIKIFFISMLFAGFEAIAFAVNVPMTLDIYGTDQITVNTLQQKLGNDLQTIANLFKDSIDPNARNKFLDLTIKTMEKINKMGNFLFVNISPLIYPNDNKIHITVDIVDQKDKERLEHFLPAPHGNFPDPDNLLKSWAEYENIGFNQLFKENKVPVFKSCPAYHCIFGFDDPALKKYEVIFNTLVPKNEDKLIDILRHDEDPSKRSKAAYLLAHIKNGNKLLAILIPSINDSKGEVRNSTMRVIGLTLFKVKPDQFPIDKVVQALDFPETSNRNKALLILQALVKQPQYAQYTILHAGDLLIRELKLLQPNVHELAYTILKTISGKNYGDRDYQAWEQWLKSAQA